MPRILPCWVHVELEDEWKRLVESQVGAHSSGYDSPTVRLYWQMVEHSVNCDLCRDDQTAQQLKILLGRK